MPISAILFGGRRASVVPLVTEAFDWEHGVFLGSIMASETTAAATGAVGSSAATPSPCSRSAATTWPTTSPTGSTSVPTTTPDRLPRIFSVNWFRRDDDGHFLWPGYGENSRVLAWIFERCAGRADAVDSPIGRHPAKDAIDADSIGLSEEHVEALFRVDVAEWQYEALAIRGSLRHVW